MVWAQNPPSTCPDGFFGHWVVDCMKRGGPRSSCVDPRHTWMSTRAKYHLQLRPGTDAALALGMLHVIINEKLYDKEFVEKWTFGFDKLKERVQQYPPSKAAEITWVPEEQIIEAARPLPRPSRPPFIGEFPSIWIPTAARRGPGYHSSLEYYRQHRRARRQRHRAAFTRRHHLSLHHGGTGRISTGRIW